MINKKSDGKFEASNSNFKVFGIGIILGLFLIGLVWAVEPTGPNSLNSVSNSTKNTTAAQMFNISGGYIATFNLSATVQDTHWKAFVGNVTGRLTLDDASGSTIFDWSYATSSGRVYATRRSDTVNWTNIGAASVANLESENGLLGQTSDGDNLSATFNDSGLHAPFDVGDSNIAANACPTLSTYVNSASQTDGSDDFEEMVLYDTSYLVFATILEDDVTGYNGNSFDFQMIVPENATTGSTQIPYYIYLEVV